MTQDKERVDLCWKERETAEINEKYQPQFDRIHRDMKLDFVNKD